jgi:hypothetical protein
MVQESKLSAIWQVGAVARYFGCVRALNLG